MTHLVNNAAIGEIGGLSNGSEYHRERHATNPETVCWNARGLTITRLRLLSDRGFPAWDVSYCHGMLNGSHVDVELPFSQLPKCGYKKAIVNYAKRERIFAKGLGILDNISTLC